MKRFHVAFYTLLLIAILVGTILGQSQTGTHGNGWQILTLTTLSILIGISFAEGVFLLIALFFRSRLPSPTKTTKQAIATGVAVLGLLFAVFVNNIAGQFLRRVFFGLQRSSHLLISDVEGYLVMLFVVGMFVGVAYISHRLYEERLGRRVAVPGRKLPKYYRLRLLAKLLFAGAFVYVLALLTTSGEWATTAQIVFEQDITSLYKETDDSLAFVLLQSYPVDQHDYLSCALDIIRDLNRRPPRVVLVPLPSELVQAQEDKTLIADLVAEGNVVFSVQPLQQLNEPERWVSHPAKGVQHFSWGVTTGIRNPFWYRPHRFFPLRYKEVSEGYPVPDAAVRVMSRFLGSTDSSNGAISDHTYTLGDYQTGLFQDGSASIRQRLDAFSLTTLRVLPSEDFKHPLYAVMAGGVEQYLTSIPDTILPRFQNRIVILNRMMSDQEREVVGWREPGGWTDARILHQMLRHESTTPLDRQTPVLVSAVLLLSIALMLYLKPLLACLLILIFGLIGQPWIDVWVLSHWGLIVEMLPPVMASLWSIPFFLLVRVLHESRQVEKDERKRIEEELKTAHDMQMGLMPTQDPKIPGFEISGVCKPADEVGGDFFDYVWLDEKKARLGIAIGDVSGKAMKAAITAVLTSGMVYREVGANETPKTILRKINRPMYLKTERRMFTAMTFAVIDTHKKTLTFSNAGQMQPMLKRRGAIRLLSVDGVRFPLGMMEDAEYHEVMIPLRSKDIVVFYTDGIPEAMNDKKEMFGFERLEMIVKESAASLSGKELAADIAGRVAEFTGSTKQNDDMTVVVVRVL